MYKGKSEIVIVNENSTEDSEPESVQKSITKNEEKYAIDETEHEGLLVIDNPVIIGTSYFSPFECGKNIEQACRHVQTSVHGHLKRQILYRNV